MNGGQCAGAERFRYLQTLVTEFQDTDSIGEGSKCGSGAPESCTH